MREKNPYFHLPRRSESEYLAGISRADCKEAANLTPKEKRLVRRYEGLTPSTPSDTKQS